MKFFLLVKIYVYREKKKKGLPLPECNTQHTVCYRVFYSTTIRCYRKNSSYHTVFNEDRTFRTVSALPLVFFGYTFNTLQIS